MVSPYESSLDHSTCSLPVSQFNFTRGTTDSDHNHRHSKIQQYFDSATEHDTLMSYLHASHLQRAPSLQHYFSTACSIDPQDPSYSCDTRKLQPHIAPSANHHHRSPATDHSYCSCAAGHNFHLSQTRKRGVNLERRHPHASSGEPHAQNLIIDQQGGLLPQRPHHSQELLPRLDLTDEDLRVLATILCVDDDESPTTAPAQSRDLARY